MKVLHFNSKAERNSRNIQGLRLGPEDITRRLFDPVREKQGLRRYALLIPDNEENKLSELERTTASNSFTEEDYERI